MTAQVNRSMPGKGVTRDLFPNDISQGKVKKRQPISRRISSWAVNFATKEMCFSKARLLEGRGEKGTIHWLPH